MSKTLLNIQLGLSSIVLPVEIIIGIIANALVMIVWQFGAKSKGMPFSRYCSTLALVDLIVLAFPATLRVKFIFTDDVLSGVPNLCRFQNFVVYAMIQNSNWISAILTLERTLTILFPVMFQTQGIKKRSKVVLILLIIYTSLNNIPHLIYAKYNDKMICHWDELYYEKLFTYELVMDTFLGVTLPIVLIITCNVVTLVVLCTCRNQTRNDSRTHVVKTFKQLTLWTGMTLFIANVMWLFCVLIIIGVVSVQEGDYANLVQIANVMLYLNSSVNPLIYFLVCKPVREDFTSGFRRVFAALLDRNSRRLDHDESVAASVTSITVLS